MQKFIQHIILFVLLIFISAPLLAQEVVAEVDSAHIMIGDHLKYTLKIKNATGIENPKADLSNVDTMKAFEVVKEFDWEKIALNDDVFYKKELTITSFDSGYYYFPSIRINYTKNGQNVSRNTQQIQLAVITPQVDSLQIRPIKDIVIEPITVADFYPLFIGLGLVLLLGIIGYLLYKRYVNKPEKEVYIAPLPPHTLALSKLKQLEEKQLWQQGKLKAYQSELTYIVREYLEKRYEIQALESTTDEIIKELKQEDISEEHKTQLSDMFRMADMVKFAKAKPPLDIQSTLLNKAEQFVQNTKKEIIIEPDNPTAE